MLFRSAFWLDVPPPQLEARLVVVELRFLPVRLDVAALAVRTQVTAMDVILVVTGCAIVRGLPELFTLYVTGDALDGRMLAQQEETGLAMIEPGLVELYDLRIPAEVIGMALAAGLFGNQMPVEAGLVGDVLRHFFVAIEAQRVLSFLVERLMALAALTFQVRMALDDFARHHQRFHRVRMGRHRTEGDGDRQQGPQQPAHHSIHVDGENVENDAKDEQGYKRNVQQMPY